MCRVCDPVHGRPRTTDDAVSAGACEICGATLDVDLDASIRASVATWPPLTPEQRDRLAVILRPSR